MCDLPPLVRVGVAVVFVVAGSSRQVAGAASHAVPVGRLVVPVTAPSLTARQQEILELMAEGLTRPQIAERLWLGIDTVGAHLRVIYARLDVHSGPAAVAAGYQHGLLGEPATTPS